MTDPHLGPVQTGILAGVFYTEFAQTSGLDLRFIQPG